MRWPSLARARAAPVAFILLVLAVLGGLLWNGKGIVASHRIGDATRYFVFAREFGFDELRRGNLALWNPHIFSGTPFVGAFQPAMLYPPNLVHLLVSVPVGINLEIAFHLLVLGLSTLAWGRGRGLSAPAALASACVVTFGASVFLRVLAGALSVLASYAWVPLLLRSIDALSRRPGLGWTLVASLAAALILLAGHPPTAFMAAFVLSLYCVPALARSRQRLRFAGCLAVMAGLSVLLAAPQLAAGLEVARDGIREGGMSYDFATSYSFPPENLLTLAVPEMFGAATPMVVDYFGRWWYWDDSAFIGVTALVLAALGATARSGPGRRTAAVLAVLLTLLALGRYTPLYGLLYRFLPGFDLLRAPSKFMFFATLFLALLVGNGADRLLAAGTGGREPLRMRTAVSLALLGALVLALGAWTVASADAPGRWSPVQLLAALNDRFEFDAAELLRWNAIAGASLRLAGATCIGLGGLFALSQRRRRAGWLIVAACILELVVFARANRGGVPADFTIRNRRLAAAVYRAAEARRVLEWFRATNYAMAVRGYSVWGYDPVVLGRYARFFARTQGQSLADLDNVEGEHARRFHPLLGLVRTHFVLKKYAFGPSGRVAKYPGELPRFLLVGRHRVVPGPDAALDALEVEGFDPRELVVLESPPEPAPAGRAVHGDVALLEESTDHLSLEVSVDAPAILLVTDAYARGWRAVALPGTEQTEYRVQPADAVLRGVALAAGRHRFRLEYVPAGYRLGWAAASLGGLIWLGTLVIWWRGRRPSARAAGAAAGSG